MRNLFRLIMDASEEIDNKVIKKHYPRDNCPEKLAFVFEKDPNLCLVKNKIVIYFVIELDEKYIPESGFAAKQFSSMEVEVDSQMVSTPKSK